MNVHRVGEMEVRDSTPLCAVGVRITGVVLVVGRPNLYLNRRAERSIWIVRVNVATIQLRTCEGAYGSGMLEIFGGKWQDAHL